VVVRMPGMREGSSMLRSPHVLRAAMLVLACAAAGCATRPVAPQAQAEMRAYASDTPMMVPASPPLSCVPYARTRSGIQIFGDAYTWWDQARTSYAREPLPRTGSVLVLDGYAGPKRAHLAVVKRIVSPREIRVDHANWLNDGNIYLNSPVVDVSANNDWSEVRVWNNRDGHLGVKNYEVRGFITPYNIAALPPLS
jgi:hypothetical protein